MKQIISITLLLLFVWLVISLDLKNMQPTEKNKIFTSPSESIVGEMKYFWSNCTTDSLMIYKAHPKPQRIVMLREKRSWFTFYRPGAYECHWYLKGKKEPIVSYFVVSKNH
ncbi:MAG: hypothetical protein ABIA91_03605 [Patescibacteria group bacterium]